MSASEIAQAAPTEIVQRDTGGIRRPLRIALIGWGAIGRRMAQLLHERLPNKIALVAVGLRNPATAENLPPRAIVITNPDALAGLRLDLVVEAAGRDAVGMWAEAALRHAGMLAVVSTSAFCDTALLDKLVAVAEEAGSQLVVPPGALAGIDAIAAASVLPLQEIVHRIVKPPAAWRGTAAESLIPLDGLSEPATIFAGSARETAARFPQNANVAIVTALAGIGLDRTRVELVADPGATGNSHRLSVRGDFGKLDIAIENRPLATNPKSSEMTALSLVRLVENRVRPLVC